MSRRFARPPLRLGIAVGLLPLVLVACGSVIDASALEAEIRDGVQSQAGVTLTEVVCPENRALSAGDVFTCTATANDGRTLEVTITQDDDQGNVRWQVTGESFASPSP
jgi:hypothetical protein